jgi:predicted phage-related endonuclease
MESSEIANIEEKNPVHIDRHKYVGGSEIAAVLGCGEYRSKMDIMDSKIKGVYGDYIRACSFGIFFEDLHRTLVSHCVGCEIVVPPPKVYDKCEYIRYSADGIGFLEDG